MFSAFSGMGTNPFVNIPQVFDEYFRCYPIAMMNDRIRKDDANYGGKIFLPPSALNKLSMLNIRYPMLFQLTANENGRITHCGVLEFTAEEGRAYIPQWMLETLHISPGSLLKITSTDVPLGQFVKLEPQSVDFLEISNPKAVLENVLRNFSTLSVNDLIEICYNNHVYKIKILEVKPESNMQSICVIETDLVTDFAPPIGYVEPDYETVKKENNRTKGDRKYDPDNIEQGSMSVRLNYSEILNSTKEASKFQGSGIKLSGKALPKLDDIKETKLSLEDKPAPLELPDGQLFFGFPIILPPAHNARAPNTTHKTFTGQGQTLRKSLKRKSTLDHSGNRAKSTKSPEVIEID